MLSYFFLKLAVAINKFSCFAIRYKLTSDVSWVGKIGWRKWHHMFVCVCENLQQSFVSLSSSSTRLIHGEASGSLSSELGLRWSRAASKTTTLKKIYANVFVLSCSAAPLYILTVPRCYSSTSSRRGGELEKVVCQFKFWSRLNVTNWALLDDRIYLNGR